MLRDIQNEPDSRNLSIDRVGIKEILYPIVLKDKTKGSQHTVAKINMYVKLPHNFKGTHMSRFIEILNTHRENISLTSVRTILDDMQRRLESEEAHIDLSFTYFMEKSAPVSGSVAMMDYACTFSASASPEAKDFVLSVNVPVLSVCPCSRDISKHGAHNQRSIVRISVRYSRMVWIEDLIEVAESAASSPIYSLLKREDEKYVTEASYEKPVFVEDIVRSVAGDLMADDRIEWFEVSSENFESIHNHSAYAVITRDKRAE